MGRRGLGPRATYYVISRRFKKKKNIAANISQSNNLYYSGTLFGNLKIMALETVPKDLRHLRACLLCSLVKVNLVKTHLTSMLTVSFPASFVFSIFNLPLLNLSRVCVVVFCRLQTIDQFEYDGCDNCESYLQMKGNREMVYECTSSSFDG